MISFFLFTLSLASSCLSQYWQKHAALLFHSQPQLSLVQKAFAKPMLLALLSLGVSFLAWLGVLSKWDVSVAYPLLSLNFVIMLLVAKYAFAETVYKRQWLGVALIIFGVILIAGGEQ
ncbi:EamA family transporter [Psychromonas sp.]|uniref:EamA family transporter n=1 Tax=Psychromonas sp. TaxID=1884585 RepID=UPI003561571D